MKAATIARYGSPGVIEVRDVPAPMPGPDEVLVRVHATTVNRTDCGEHAQRSGYRLLSPWRHEPERDPTIPAWSPNPSLQRTRFARR
jgi:NADPH:quinone reductase-like Zn-dependent oxidoreductase